MISPYFLPSLRLWMGALAALGLAAPVGAYQEQPQEQGTVGPAEIRDFSLPATRQPRPEPAPTIAPLTPPVAQPEPTVATPTPAPTVTLTPAPPAEAATAAPTTRAPSGRTTAPAPTQSGPAPTLPQPQDPQEALPVAPAPTIAPQPLPQSAPIAEPPAAIAPEPEPEGGFPWLYLLLGAGVAGLGFLGWRRFAKAGEAPTESFAIAAAPRARKPEPRPEPKPQRAPAPAAVTAEPGAIGIVMRPWLEIEFKPDRATATADGAGVQYEIVIRNTGNAPARNVRLAAQMFNAGPELDKEIAVFFAATVDDRGAAPLTLLPRTEVRIQSQVGMPRAEMREIKVQGRSLFIPTVAFNLLYNWGRDKTGQTCSSHIVGREPETPSQKMAPFRLDLGPRTYRQVGQRPSALARAV